MPRIVFCAAHRLDRQASLPGNLLGLPLSKTTSLLLSHSAAHRCHIHTLCQGVPGHEYPRFRLDYAVAECQLASAEQPRLAMNSLSVAAQLQHVRARE